MIKVLDKKYKLIILALVAVAILVIVYMAVKDSGRSVGDEEIAREEVPVETITESIDQEQDDQFKADSEPFNAFIAELNSERPLVLYFYSQT